MVSRYGGQAESIIMMSKREGLCGVLLSLTFPENPPRGGGIYPGTGPGALLVHRNRCGCFWFSRLFGWDSVYAPESVRLFQILAGAVREIGSDLRISPYLSNTSQPTLGLPLRRGHYR